MTSSYSILMSSNFSLVYFLGVLGKFKSSTKMLDKVCESQQPCLFPDLIKLRYIHYDVNDWLHIVFIICKYMPSSNIFKVFIMKDAEIFFFGVHFFTITK